MLAANLLPAEEKKIVRLAEYRHISGILCAGIGSLLIVGLILLFPAYISLSIEKTNLEREDSKSAELARTLGLKEVFSQATQTSALVGGIRDFLAKPSRGYGLFKILLADTGRIRVDAFSIGANGEMSLNGFAKTRDDLLAFQKELQDSGLFKNVSFPVSDILKSADLHFTMSGTFKAGQGLK